MTAGPQRIPPPTPTSPWSSAVDWAHAVRWAGTKDGLKSRTRARSVLPSDEPLAGALTPVRALEVRERLKGAGLSPATVNRHLSAYFAVWRECYRLGAVGLPPPSGMMLREPRGRVRVVTAQELATVLDRLSPVYGRLVQFLSETGCRVSEALHLDGAKDVDRAARTVTFRNTKNGDDRTVPLSDLALEIARERPGMFAGLSQATLNREWAAVRDSVGLDREFVPHALRHTYATRLVAAGVPIAAVSKLLGHRNLRTTERYTHLSTGDLLTALERAGIL